MSLHSFTIVVVFLLIKSCFSIWGDIFSDRIFDRIQYPLIVSCSNASRIDPSLGDILARLSSGKSDHYRKSNSQNSTIDWFSDRNLFSTIFNWNVPFLKMFAAGKFKIDLSNSSESMENIYIMKPKGFINSKICSLEGKKSGNAFFSHFCKCNNGLSDIEDYPGYCIHRPCLDVDQLFSGKCEVDVDPWIVSCIVLDSERFDNDEQHVSYEEYIPSMRFYGEFLHAIVDSIKNSFENTASSETLVDLLDLLNLLAYFVSEILKYFPLYLFNLSLGIFLISSGEELASSRVFQVLVFGTLGLLAAAVFAVFVLFKMLDSFMKRTLPLGSTIPMVVVSSSFLLYGTSILRYSLILLWKFWDTGYPFPVPWLGKAYFVVSFLLVLTFVTLQSSSYATTSFQQQTLLHSLYALGGLCLYHGSSNHLLSFFMASLIFFWDDLIHIFWALYVYYHGRVQDKSHLPKISMDMYDKQTEDFTAKSLRQLQEYMIKHPRVQEQYLGSMKEAEKYGQIHAMNRFLAGESKGRPRKLSFSSDHDDNDDENEDENEARSAKKSKSWNNKAVTKASSGLEAKKYLYWLLAVAFMMSGILAFLANRSSNQDNRLP